MSNTEDKAMSDQYFFSSLIDSLIRRYPDKGVSAAPIITAIKNSISIESLINTLAEVFRSSKDEIERNIEELGFEELVKQYKFKNAGSGAADAEINLCEDYKNPFPELFDIHSVPGLSEPIPISGSLKSNFIDLFSAISLGIKGDSFLKLYREDVLGYYSDFINNTAPLIKDEISRLFGKGYPKYMVTTGIGANEQFNHFVAQINNNDPKRCVEWLVINSPKKLSLLPGDATVDNTLFLEFSRSSLTEETVKIHEYTPRNAKRIVFSNSGPLKEIAQRDNNLILTLPDQVSGRFGRNKTPILLAPMFIAKMNTEEFWKDIDNAISAFDISNQNSLPFLIAKFIIVSQKTSSRNFIYFGCNDDALSKIADEFIQYWNEGVNKGGNDLMVSSFFGLPRDSHMNLEGVLGNNTTKMALFLINTRAKDGKLHPLISNEIDPINPAHKGLHFGDEEVILAIANYKRISEKMPALLIDVNSAITLRHSAVLGQLFADVTYIYSRLMGIDPGSNPEVKFVRERSASLLAETAEKLRETDSPVDEILFSK